MRNAHQASNRGSRRAPVLLTASIDVDGPCVSVKLRNLSGQGALIEADRLPAEVSTTCFRRMELSRRRQVVWVQSRFAAVAFDQSLNPPQSRHAHSPDASGG